MCELIIISVHSIPVCKIVQINEGGFVILIYVT